MDNIKDFEEKKAAYENGKDEKREKYKNKIAKAKKESESRLDAAHSISKFIPLGQPILVGHHSEKRHRSDLSKIDNNMRKAIEADKKAGYYAANLSALDTNSAIISSDPEAVALLKDKIDNLLKIQNFMKKVNREYKKYLKAKSEGKKYKMDLTEAETKKAVNEISKMPAYERNPYPTWALSNNTANIRRLKKRLESLEKFAQVESAEYKVTELPGYTFKRNTIENRFEIHTPGKPSPEIRSILKRNGFKFSYQKICWQRFLSTIGGMERYIINELKANINKKEGTAC